MRLLRISPKRLDYGEKCFHHDANLPNITTIASGALLASPYLSSNPVCESSQWGKADPPVKEVDEWRARSHTSGVHDRPCHTNGSCLLTGRRTQLKEDLDELRAEDYRYTLRILRYTVRRHSASPTLSRSEHPDFPANRACRESNRWREKLMSSKERSCARNPADGVLSQHGRSPTAQFRHEYSLPLQAKLWDDIREGTKASTTP